LAENVSRSAANYFTDGATYPRTYNATSDRTDYLAANFTASIWRQSAYCGLRGGSNRIFPIGRQRAHTTAYQWRRQSRAREDSAGGNLRRCFENAFTNVRRER
jgi:hypothetical protein